MFGSTLSSRLGQPSDTAGWAYADATGEMSRLTGAAFEVYPHTGKRTYILFRRNRLGNAVPVKKGFRSRKAAETYGAALANDQVYVIERGVPGVFRFWLKTKPEAAQQVRSRHDALAFIRQVCRGAPVIETRRAAGA